MPRTPKARKRTAATPYAQGRKQSTKRLGPLSDADDSLRGLGKTRAREVNEARIKDVVEMLVPPCPDVPVARGWNGKAPQLCTGLQGAKEGRADEDCNIGRWFQYQTKKNRPTEHRIVFLNLAIDTDILTNSQVFTTWLVIRRELLPTPKGQATPLRILSSSPPPPESVRDGPDHFPSSSSTLVPSSPLRASSPQPSMISISSSSDADDDTFQDDKDYTHAVKVFVPSSPLRASSPRTSVISISSSSDADDNNVEEDKDFTHAAKVFIWNEDEKRHVQIVLFPRREDGCLHLWDYTNELGAHGIEVANDLDLYGGRFTGWQPHLWAMPISVDFPGQAFFIKYSAVTSVLHFDDTFTVCNTTRQGKARAH